MQESCFGSLLVLLLAWSLAGCSPTAVGVPSLDHYGTWEVVQAGNHTVDGPWLGCRMVIGVERINIERPGGELTECDNRLLADSKGLQKTRCDGQPMEIRATAGDKLQITLGGGPDLQLQRVSQALAGPLGPPSSALLPALAAYEQGEKGARPGPSQHGRLADLDGDGQEDQAVTATGLVSASGTRAYALYLSRDGQGVPVGGLWSNQPPVGMETRTHGLRELLATSSLAGTQHEEVYCFDGRGYVLVRARLRAPYGPDGKLRHFPLESHWTPWSQEAGSKRCARPMASPISLPEAESFPEGLREQAPLPYLARGDFDGNGEEDLALLALEGRPGGKKVGKTLVFFRIDGALYATSAGVPPRPIAIWWDHYLETIDHRGQTALRVQKWESHGTTYAWNGQRMETIDE